MIAAPSTTWQRARLNRLTLTPPIVLGGLFAASVAVRLVLAIPRRAASYLPDEWIYAGLSRSLAHGRLAIHGDTAHFPALLQPILAAPLWRFFPVDTAYRLVQVENAVAASLVVIPVYLLARFVGLSRRQAYLCCVYALVLPMLTWVPVTIADFVAYPLALGGVAAAVRAIDRPTRRRQVVFLALTVLATLARTQYFVLAPAYLVAAVWIERRRAPRRHAAAFAAMVPVAVAVVVGLVSFYKFGRGSFSTATLVWIPLQAFLLAVITGGLIVPGAVAALIRNRERSHRAFAIVTSVFAAGLLGETSVYAAQEGRLKERYLFVLLPLTAISFLLYLKRERPHAILVLCVSAALVAAAAYLPVTRYAKDARIYDSPSLIAVSWLQEHTTATIAALIVSLTVTAGSALALATRWHRVAAAGVPLAISFAVLITVGSTQLNVLAHHQSHARDEWIAKAVPEARHVTLIATPFSAPIEMMKLLYWNPVLDREVVLAPSSGSDTYAKTNIEVAPSGRLLNVGKYFVFDKQASQATIAGAEKIRTRDDFVLYRATGTPRFTNAVLAQLSTGDLSPFSVIRIWTPRSRAGKQTYVSFTLTRRTGVPAARMFVGPREFTIRPGTSARIVCPIRPPVSEISVRSFSEIPDMFNRPVTVALKRLRTIYSPVAGASATRCARTS